MFDNVKWFLEFQHKKKNSYLRHARQRPNINEGNCYNSAKFSPALWRDEHNVVNSTLLFLFQFMGNYSTVFNSSSADLAAEHFFFSPIDKTQNVKLYWNVDAAKKEIFFTVEAKTTGWVGLSISSGQK